MEFSQFINTHFEKEVDGYIFLKPQVEDLNAFIADLNYVYGFNYLLELFAVDLLNQGKENRFEIYLHIRNLAKNTDIILKFMSDGELLIDDLDIWENIDWAKREMYDLHGIGKIKSRILTTRNFNGHPFLKDFIFVEDEVQSIIGIDDVRNKTVIYSEHIKEDWYEIKPFEFSDDHFFKALIDNYDDHISKIHFEVGYTHQGLEKIFETMNPVQTCTLIDQISPQSLNQASMLFCKAVEHLIGVTVSDRVVIIRMIMAEFGRINSHLYSLTNLFNLLNVDSFMAETIQIKDRLHILLKRVSGSRFLKNYNVIGGVRFDIPLGWSSDCIDFITKASKIINNLIKKLAGNLFFKELIEGKSLDSKLSIYNGVTGPLLRSSGINYDIRKVKPYYFYSELDFEAIVGVNGQSYDLLMIKLHEINQSMRIILQLLDNIPQGKIHSQPIDRLFDYVNEVFQTQKDSLRSDVIDSIESSNGEMGLYLVVGQDSFFERVKIKTPSFVNLQASQNIFKGHDIDSFNIYSSLINYQISEVDR